MDQRRCPYCDTVINDNGCDTCDTSMAEIIEHETIKETQNQNQYNSILYREKKEVEDNRKKISELNETVQSLTNAMNQQLESKNLEIQKLKDKINQLLKAKLLENQGGASQNSNKSTNLSDLKISVERCPYCDAVINDNGCDSCDTSMAEIIELNKKSAHNRAVPINTNNDREYKDEDTQDISEQRKSLTSNDNDEDKWTCKQCSLKNAITDMNCEACLLGRKSPVREISNSCTGEKTNIKYNNPNLHHVNHSVSSNYRKADDERNENSVTRQTNTNNSACSKKEDIKQHQITKDEANDSLVSKDQMKTDKVCKGRAESSSSNRESSSSIDSQNGKLTSKENNVPTEDNIDDKVSEKTASLRDQHKSQVEKDNKRSRKTSETEQTANFPTSDTSYGDSRRSQFQSLPPQSSSSRNRNLLKDGDNRNNDKISSLDIQSKSGNETDSKHQLNSVKCYKSQTSVSNDLSKHGQQLPDGNKNNETQRTSNENELAGHLSTLDSGNVKLSNSPAQSSTHHQDNEPSWNCAQCTYKNVNMNAVTCKVCGIKRGNNVPTEDNIDDKVSEKTASLRDNNKSQVEIQLKKDNKRPSKTSENEQTANLPTSDTSYDDSRSFQFQSSPPQSSSSRNRNESMFWICEKCTFHNLNMNAVKCETCGLSKCYRVNVTSQDKKIEFPLDDNRRQSCATKEFTPGSDSMDDIDESRWTCGFCHTTNSLDDFACKTCSNLAKFFDKWRCMKCTFINPKLQERCNMCNNRNDNLITCNICKLNKYHQVYDQSCEKCLRDLQNDKKEIPYIICKKCNINKIFAPNKDICVKCDCSNRKLSRPDSTRGSSTTEVDSCKVIVETKTSNQRKSSIITNICDKHKEKLCSKCYWLCIKPGCNTLNKTMTTRNVASCRKCGILHGEVIKQGYTFKVWKDNGNEVQMWCCVRCYEFTAGNSKCNKCSNLRYLPPNKLCGNCRWVNLEIRIKCDKCDKML